MWQQAKNIYHLLISFFVNLSQGFPGRKLIVIGVTGTSGKTTTSHMLYEVLRASGKQVALISSIKAVIGGKDIDTGFHVTTPGPDVLPKYLHQAVEAHDHYVVLEVSSHALDQNRAAFIPFHIGVLTTLAHEHLDYHKTFLNYAKAKFKLLHRAKTAVIPEKSIPLDIKKGVHYEKLKKVVTFGLSQGQVTQSEWQLRLKVPGDYNLLNALAAAAVGELLHIPHDSIKKTLENFSAIPGRFEEIPNAFGFRVIIDFAHKPDALEEVLKTARKQVTTNGRIIVMYGCASQRDVLKRPIMGKISGELAEITVLTDEDPRLENSMKIINEIAQGCLEAHAKEISARAHQPSTKTHVFYKIPNRKEAIIFIITKLARKDDIILFCGKGHEQSMNYHGIETPWNEHLVVANALAMYGEKKH